MSTQRSGKTRLGVTARLAAVMALAIAVTATPVLPIGDADAAARGGFGGRGTKTFQAPPSTPTAPGSPRGIDRTTTPRPAQPGVGAPGTIGQPAARPGGLFGGFGGALLGGLALGGLFGLLSGGGFGGLAGFFGLLLQVALIAGVVMLALRFFRGRSQQPAYGSAAPHERTGDPTGPTGPAGPLSGGLAGLGASLGGLGQRPAAPAAGPSDEIGLREADFNTFERLLGEIETAYSTGDVGKLREIATPEAASYLNDQIDENEAKGVVNDVRDVKLLQGDLAEAWREGPLEYATVALRFSMIDVTRDKATGRILDGDPVKPTELTQVWTFVREPAAVGTFDQWRLSAIQDT
jgi:predicted lipid-binding transport protein (Tim44 family)